MKDIWCSLNKTPTELLLTLYKYSIYNSVVNQGSCVCACFSVIVIFVCFSRQFDYLKKKVLKIDTTKVYGVNCQNASRTPDYLCLV